MVHSKVKAMKLVMLLVAGLWLAACADERGFRPKAWPSTADQEQKKAGKNCPCDAAGNPTGSASPSQPQSPQAPSKQSASPVQNIVNPSPAQSSSAAAAPVQHQDEVLDHTIHTIVEQLEPGSASADVETKFRNNLTPSARAIQIIKGMDITQMDANGQGVQVEVKTLINDDGGDDKTLIATGAVPYGTEKLTQLKTSPEDINATVFAFFCSREDCGDGPGLLRVYMMVSPAKGEPVVAIFMQSLINNGQNTIIKSSIVTPFPSFDSVYSAKQTMNTVIGKRADDKKDSEVKGDPKGGMKAPVRLAKIPVVKKDQSRLPQEPNSKPEKAVITKKTTESAPAKQDEQKGASSSQGREPKFRQVVVIHDNDKVPMKKVKQSTANTSSVLTPPVIIPSLTPEQAKKAMDDALKSKAVSVPSETLPSDVLSTSAQLQIPSMSSDDAKKAWDAALKKTMKSLNMPQEVKAPETPKKPTTTPAAQPQPPQNNSGLIST